MPDGETLALAARRAARIAKIQKQIEELATTDEEIDLPDDLDAQVRKALDEEPERTWDEVLVEIMREHQEPGSSEDDRHDRGRLVRNARLASAAKPAR